MPDCFGGFIFVGCAMAEDVAIQDAITPSHQWTNGGGKVRILKAVDGDRKAYGGFIWPESGDVKPNSWKPNNKCGNGLHGWAWGIAMGDGKEINFIQNLWIVFETDPTDVVSLGGKVKAKQGTVVFCGKWVDAQKLILPGQIAWIQYASSGSASATGYSGVAVGTGAHATVECGESGLCAVTAPQVYWRIRKGAVLCQRTSEGAWMLLANGMSDVKDGDLVCVTNGKWELCK